MQWPNHCRKWYRIKQRTFSHTSLWQGSRLEETSTSAIRGTEACHTDSKIAWLYPLNQDFRFSSTKIPGSATGGQYGLTLGWNFLKWVWSQDHSSRVSPRVFKAIYGVRYCGKFWLNASSSPSSSSSRLRVKRWVDWISEWALVAVFNINELNELPLSPVSRRRLHSTFNSTWNTKRITKTCQRRKPFLARRRSLWVKCFTEHILSNAGKD